MSMGWRERTEARFEAWGRFVARRPWLVLVSALVGVAACMGGLPRVRVDVTFEAFLRPSDPVLIAYEAFRERFGRDERILVAAGPGPEAGPNGVFEADFLERFAALHEDLESRVPLLEDLTSLVNARDTRGEGDVLRVDDFLDPWPADEEAREARRERALANPLFRGTVLSADARLATIVLELPLYSALGDEQEELGGFESADDDGSAAADAIYLTGAETAEIVQAVHRVVDTHRAPDFEIHVAGSPVMLQDVAGSMARDMPRFVALAVGTIAALLFLLFRRWLAVLTPLVVVALALGSTIGLMGWTDTALHVPSQVLPTFLLAVGVGDAVHLLAIFFVRLRDGESRDEAVAHALGHSGLAIVLTSVTTAGGLASFVTADIAPIAAIGLFAPAGVVIALLLSVSLLPALLVLLPIAPPREARSGRGTSWIDRGLASAGRFAIRNARGVVAVSLLIAIGAAFAASRLGFSHDPLGWLPEDAPVVRGTRAIDEALSGSFSFEVLLRTEEAGGVRQPAALRRLAALGESFETEPRDGIVAGQSTALPDVVKEIHRALNEDRPEAYRIPDDPRLVRQELLLFENTGSDDLEDLVDPDYGLARLTVRVPWRDAIEYAGFFDIAGADAERALGEIGEVGVTGVLALIVRAIGSVIRGMAESYVLAFAVITPLMVVLLGSLRMGLLAMIPNLMPILLTLGLMGALGLPLDAFSLMVGGIALGLAVDDTIHFMHNFRRYRGAGLDLEAAVDQTLRTTGRALLITTIVLSAGFLGFVLSSMQNLADLGLLVSFAITVALLADVLLAPALLAVAGGGPPLAPSPGGDDDVRRRAAPGESR